MERGRGSAGGSEGGRTRGRERDRRRGEQLHKEGDRWGDTDRQALHLCAADQRGGLERPPQYLPIDSARRPPDEAGSIKGGFQWEEVVTFMSMNRTVMPVAGWDVSWRDPCGGGSSEGGFWAV